jgi:DNA-binding NtrC family response regulator
LAAEVSADRFREDLYFRVAVIEIEVPALRDRPSDIPLLARHFLNHFTEKQGRRPMDLAPETLDLLATYSWPGNVREVQNAIERAVLVANGGRVRPRDFPARIRNAPPGGRNAGTAAVADASQPLTPSTGPADRSVRATGAKTLDELERDAIVAALERHNGNISHVVRELGIGRTTLYRKLKRYNLR